MIKGIKATIEYKVRELDFTVKIELRGKTYPIKDQIKAAGLLWDGSTWSKSYDIAYKDFSIGRKQVDELIEALAKIGIDNYLADPDECNEVLKRIEENKEEKDNE